MARQAVTEAVSHIETSEDKALAVSPTRALVLELRTANSSAAYSQENTRREADAERYTKSGILSSNFQLPESAPHNRAYAVYEQSASQALQPPPLFSDKLKNAPYNSPIKLNVQITNVPEVSQGLLTDGSRPELLNYLSTVSQSGANAVRGPVLAVAEYLAQPNIVNNDLLKFETHYAQGSGQFNNDIEILAGQAIQQIEQLIDQFDKPQTWEQRAEMAGAMLPLFFMDGQVMHPKVAQQMGLESMTVKELDNLGIKRVEVKLKLERDEHSIKGSIPGDPKAFVEAKLPSPGVVDVTYINRGDLPEGMGGNLLAQTLQGHRALPTQQLVFSGIINPETLEQFKAGWTPDSTLLGKSGTKAMRALGIEPASHKFETVEGKLNLIIEAK